MRTLQVKVKANARKSVLEPPDEDAYWTARLKSPPVDGKANKEVIALLANHFKCPKSRVIIARGISSRLKHIRIEDT